MAMPPGPGLFRPEALEHYLDQEEGRLVRVSPPWTWALLVILLAAMGAGLAVAIFGQVEVTGRARGILHPESGIPMLLCQVDGTVAEVAVHSGEAVREGQLLLRIDAPLVQAQLHEARRGAEAVRREFVEASRCQDRAFGQQQARMAQRLARLEEQIDSQAQSAAMAGRWLEANLRLAREGILSPAKADEAREAHAEARRALNRSEQAREQALQERAALDHQRQEHLWGRSRTIRDAETREQALAFIQAQTVVRAPRAGIVEAVLVKPGETVAPGRALGKLVPEGARLQAVCFLAEKDRAFVKAGDRARLELAQLPYAEYGTAAARVLRISADLASPHEIQEALGEAPAPGAPTFRVELEITGAAPAARAGVPLRSGMVLDARFTLRRQRLITLVLDPLRKWLQ